MGLTGVGLRGAADIDAAVIDNNRTREEVKRILSVS